MIHRLVGTATRNLNQFPVEHRVLIKYNLLVIVTRYGATDYKLLSIDFEVYVEMYEDNWWVTSSNKPRYTSAICLDPTSCRNLSQYFILLVIGKMLRQKSWIKLLMLLWVVNCVYFIAKW